MSQLRTLLGFSMLYAREAHNFWLFLKKNISFFRERESYYVAKPGLELMVLSSQPPTHLDCRCAPLCLTIFTEMSFTYL